MWISFLGGTWVDTVMGGVRRVSAKEIWVWPKLQMREVLGHIFRVLWRARPHALSLPQGVQSGRLLRSQPCGLHNVSFLPRPFRPQQL